MQKKKVEKKFLVCEIIASEMPAVNCPYYEGNTCHGQVTPLRNSFKTLHISKRDFVQHNCFYSDQ